MALSGITNINTVESVRHLASFSNGSDLYGLWTGQAGFNPCMRTLTWRKHGLDVPYDVIAALVLPYETPSAAVRYDGALAVAYADAGTAAAGIWVVVFDLLSGATVVAPRQVASGSSPIITTVPLGKGLARLTLLYIRGGQPRIRESLDGGPSWSGERPVLNAKAGETSYISKASFDGSHLSLMQVSSDARTIVERSSLSRTRPISAIIKHPTDSGRFYAVESVHRTVAAVEQVSDNERGYLTTLQDGTVLTSSRVRAGTADAYGDVMLIDATGSAPTVSASAVAPAGTAPGADAVTVLANAAGAGSVLASAVFGAANAAIVDVLTTNSYAYFAGYTDQSATGGALAVLQLSDNTVAQPLTGVSVRALALGQGLLAVATTEAGVEKVRFYAENALTPTLLATHVLPMRANSISLVMSSPSAGLLYVSGTSRLNIYQISGTANPIRLVSSLTILTAWSTLQHFDVAITSKGFIVAAGGSGGVMVYNSQGEMLSQLPVSGVAVAPWTPGRTVVIGDLVRPSASSFYVGKRTYFRCSTGGTTGAIEPPWAPSPATTADGTAVWTEVGPYEGVVTSVALDETRRRILAAGLAGGPSGTMGKIWMIDAPLVL